MKIAYFFSLQLCLFIVQQSANAQSTNHKPANRQKQKESTGGRITDMVSLSAGYDQSLDKTNCIFRNGAVLALEVAQPVMHDHMLFALNNSFHIGLSTNNPWVNRAFADVPGIVTKVGSCSGYDISLFLMPVLHNSRTFSLVIGPGIGGAITYFPITKVRINNADYTASYSTPLFSLNGGLKSEMFLRNGLFFMFDFRTPLTTPSVDAQVGGYAHKLLFSYQHVSVGVGYRIRFSSAASAERDENKHHNAHNYSEGR